MRETWAREDLGPDDYPQLVWRADMEACQFSSEASTSPRYYLPSDHKPDRWRPSIHMPRWASRITLEVTDVRVERVRDIGVADALAEGVKADPLPDMGGWPIQRFHTLWDSINAKRGYGWDVNPWVWVVGFKVLR